MAFWCRVKNSKIKTLTNHVKRCYFQSHNPNALIASASQTSARVLSNSPSLTIPKSPFEFQSSVRFFAAPVQAKTKKEEKDTSGPRLNQEITAAFVRLVHDEGHRVVSICEALELARSLKLDLVEVARDAKPPVCKIMDYHKEKYQQQLKESAKSKSETLKKGNCKDVRFVGKIEQKDLKVKADQIKRMMERGYRVKCTAMSMGTEGEDLGAVLSRLSSLIEDVAYVESGPRVEKAQAYILVRHVKFGPSKKGSGKKVSKESKSGSFEEDAESSLQLNKKSDVAEASVESDSGSCPEEMTDEDRDDSRSDWRVSGAEGDSDKVSDFTDGKIVGAKIFGSASVTSDFARLRPVHDSSRTGPALPSYEEQSDFRREPGNTSLPTNSLPSSSQGSRSTTIVDTQCDLGRQPPPGTSTTGDLGSQFSRKFPVKGSPQQHPSQPSIRSSPSSGYGIFSSPQAGSPANKENNVAAENRYKKRNNSGRNSSSSDPRGLPSNAQARTPAVGRRDGQGKYGIFSESSNMIPNRNPDNQAKLQR